MPRYYDLQVHLALIISLMPLWLPISTWLFHFHNVIIYMSIRFYNKHPYHHTLQADVISAIKTSISTWLHDDHQNPCGFHAFIPSWPFRSKWFWNYYTSITFLVYTIPLDISMPSYPYHCSLLGSHGLQRWMSHDIAVFQSLMVLVMLMS